MESVFLAVRDFVVLYLLVALLMQLIGDGQINKYVRFFAGMVFVLMLMSPFYQMIMHAPLEKNLRMGQLKESYISQLEFEHVLEQFSGQTAQTAIGILMDRFNETLAEKGYEIKQYDCKVDEEDQLTEANLYVGKKDDKGSGLAGMTTEVSCAQECRALLIETWNPEFELKVYGKDGT